MTLIPLDRANFTAMLALLLQSVAVRVCKPGDLGAARNRALYWNGGGFFYCIAHGKPCYGAVWEAFARLLAS